LRRNTAAAIATVSSIATTAAATAFAGSLVEFFAATTARPLVLALRTATTTAATRLLHATGAAAVLALMDRARLWFGRAGTVTGGERDFELIELVPLFVGTVAIRDRQQFLQARPR
jgi:flavin reductase (DIM6/NTAB) family NADH-FMN oxidoreductase RutF